MNEEQGSIFLGHEEMYALRTASALVESGMFRWLPGMPVMSHTGISEISARSGDSPFPGAIPDLMSLIMPGFLLGLISAEVDSIELQRRRGIWTFSATFELGRVLNTSAYAATAIGVSMMGIEKMRAKK